MKFTLTVSPRVGNALGTRAQGNIPAVVYGPDVGATSLSVPYTTFEKIYSAAGESSLIDLTVEGGKTFPVVIKDLQHDPVKGRIVHVDFYQIDMNKEMETAIELHFIGEAPAEKQLGGTLVEGRSNITVTCLPQNLVPYIDVDLSTLKTFEDSIHIKDITLPAGLVTADDPEAPVAKVVAPLTDEQFKAMEQQEVQDVSKVEIETKKKETPEEGAQAEEAPPKGEKQ